MEDEMGAPVPCQPSGNVNIPDKKRKQPEGPDKEDAGPPKKQDIKKVYLLSVRVLHENAPVDGATVSLTDGSQAPANNGVARFGPKPEGHYTISAVSFPPDADYADLHPSINVGLSQDTTVEVTVQKKNIVSAKIEAEYKVILLDRALSQYQAGGEKKIETDAFAYVRVSFGQTNPAFTYTGEATLTCSGNVALFSDKACTQAFNGTIANNIVRSGGPVDYYLKSASAGLFNCSVALAPTGDANVKLAAAPPPEAMSVAEVKLNVFTNDHAALQSKTIVQDVHPISAYHNALDAYVIPPQIEMTDSDKIQKGRFLHAQKGNNHARAKIRIKIDAAQWPAESDSYTLELVSPGGKIKIFDAETAGSEIKTGTEIKISDLKAAGGEKIYWVEGASATSALNEALLGITLNRPPGGLPHTKKANADWARFTVVSIDTVELNYTPGVVNAWDSAVNRFYINLMADPDGRKIKLKATISPKISDVPIHFMLAGDPANGNIPKDTTWAEENWKETGLRNWDWSSISAVLKQKDRTNRDDFLHYKKNTDANGEAEVEVILSRFAGEKYTPGCYIHEDPHLAKYINGHPQLGNKRPVLRAHAIEVYRKFWYQLVKVTGTNPPANWPALAGAEGIYENVKAKMEKTATDLTVPVADARAVRAIYPRYMIEPKGGNGEALVISDRNRDAFFGGYAAEADKPLKFPILICDARWNTDGTTALLLPGWIETTRFPMNLSMDKLIINPPLQGGDLFISGTYDTARQVAGAWVPILNGSGPLTAANFSVDSNRDSLNKVWVTLPATTPVGPGIFVYLDNVSLHGARALLGAYNPGTKRLFAVYDPAEPVDFQNTIAHETGHALHQTQAGGSNGLPAHPNQYRSAGSHCDYNINKCLMYESGPIIGSLDRYCPVCHPYLLCEDMSKLA